MNRLLLSRRVDDVRSRLKVNVCTLYRAHPEDDSLEIVATSGLNQDAVGARLSCQQGLTGKVARTGKPLAARDIQSHSDYFHVQGSGEERFRSYLGIPLHRGDDLLGVLVIQTEDMKTFFLKDIRELHSAGRDVMDSLVEWAETA